MSPPQSSDLPTFRMAEVVSALSFGLDLTEGQPAGHSVRACILGMRIAQEIGLSETQLGNLYYALLIKDSGCSSNASRMFHIFGDNEIHAKRDIKIADWSGIQRDTLRYALSHVAPRAPFLERVKRLYAMAANRSANARQLVQLRCQRGAFIARRMGLSEDVAAGIYSLDEHWNGMGQPDGLKGLAIPLFSRIMLLAQTLEVFFTHHGPEAALGAIRRRAGRWFDPDLTAAAGSVAARGALWRDLDQEGLLPVVALEPGELRFTADSEALDNICLAFADVIDAKSPFTYRHSNGVARAAGAIGRQLGMSASELGFLRRAALLHDIGKLSVPNTILEKPGQLDASEWDVVKKHPYYTLEILRRIPGFEELSDVAAAHHEKLDGSGYFRRWGARELNRPARILAVADIFDALAAKRPYRDALPLEAVFRILEKDAGRAIDAECVEALKCAPGIEEPAATADLGRLAAATSETPSCLPADDAQRKCAPPALS